MAEGIRIRHKTHRNVLLFVVDTTSRVDPPYSGCGRCNLPPPGHNGYKTRHFELDDDGTTIVSEGVLGALRRLIGHGGFDLETTNVVANPPSQGILVASNGGVSVAGRQLPTEAITTHSKE